MSTTEELAWLAGFTDGEGHFGCSLRSNGQAVQFVINQNGNREILEKCQRILGFGKINGPYERAGRKPNYRFCVQRFSDFKRVFDLLSPYLSTVKHNQALNVIRIVEAARAKKTKGPNVETY